MTIARRRAPLDAVAAPHPPTPVTRAPAPGVRVPVPLGDAPAPEVKTPAGRLRRCTYRRLDAVAPLPGRPALPTYEIMCLYADAEHPLPLGDLADAHPVCDACTARGIFRPDEA